MMAEVKQLKKRLSFKELPPDWHLQRVSVDWSGEPLVLFAEGTPQQPPREADIDTIVAWMNSPPSAHNLVYWSDGTTMHTRFANPMQLTLTMHVQPFGSGWLLGEGRG